MLANKKEGETEIWVQDFGMGMPSETVQKLFNKENFYTTVGTKKEKGTGLGLILTQKYVEKHGRRIWIESEPGRGSIFKFSIPDCYK